MKPRTEHCANCGKAGATESLQDQTILYGDGEQIPQIELLVKDVPVFTCPHCGIEYTDHRAEGMRDRIVSLHRLGLL